ncbi:MAG: lysine--tRNA ligase, partial [Pseudonocardiaceae bacterium]
DDLDRGDWVGVAGTVMTTRRGELSIRVEKFQLLAKAVVVPPDKYHGLTDVQTRYRQRDVDLAANESTRRIFRIRHAAISAIRGYLTEHGFTEVESPVLQTIQGGASARPFRTHHNALNLDLYLRIALELHLKRLIVGGMERVFEIGRVFRNEGIDTRHNPEFTMLEAYQAFADYHDVMDLVEGLIVHTARATLGERLVVGSGGQEIDLRPPWPRVRMAELIARHTGADMHPGMGLEQARAVLDERGVPYEQGWGPGRLMKQLYDEKVQHQVRGPLFCLDYPREVSPLARAHRDDPEYVERFELIVAGFELCNAYSEQNDPAAQLVAFEAEARAKQGGDPEAGDVDLDYIRALEHGMPPTGGLGIGIDRLIMLLAGVDSIREVILFPTLRPETPAVSGPVVSGPAVRDTECRNTVSPSRLPTAPPPRERSRWPLRVIAGATAAGGVAQLLALLPFLHERMRPFELTFAPWFDTAGRVASVLIGLLLILLAGQLAKGKRTAWRIAVGLFALGAVVHVLKGPHPVAVAVCLGMVVALVLTRRLFRAGPDPPSLLRLARFVPVYLAAVLGFGFLSLYLERNRLSPPLSVPGGLATVLGGLIGLDGPYAYQRPRFAEFFPAALLALGVLGLVVFAVLLFRPLRAGRPHTDADWQRAQRLVHTYGWDTLAYFALRDDKSFFFGSDGEAMLAYTYLGGYALVSGDPIGAPDSVPAAIDEFLALCAERAWQPAFLAVREADFPAYAARGFRSFYLGDEAILRCDEFSLAGGARKSVRSAARRIGRSYRFQLISESEAAPRLVEQLNAISARWRGKAPERGFTMSLSQDIRGAGANPEFLLCVALGADGTPGGFLRLVPAYGPDFGYTLDLMRHDPEAPNGMTEFLIAGAARELGARGVVRLSMNFAVWGRLFADDIPFTAAQRLAKRAVEVLNPFFQIKSLHDFNAKFDPQWLPRVLVYRGPADLARVGLLYAGAEGFLAVPGVGALLVPKAVGGVAAPSAPPVRAA